MENNSFLRGKKILAVDNEWDIIETIKRILKDASLDVALDHETAQEKIIETQYDLAVIDIMQSHGIELLEECVKRDIPTVILISVTAKPDVLMEAVKKGAVSYLAKKHIDKIARLTHKLFDMENSGNPSWKLMYKNLKEFNRSFHTPMEGLDGDFWTRAEKKWDISKGIQERLLHSKEVVDKGI